ncbi:zinc ribbon domain-containing protein [Amycolatopsis magusensis]|uniref:Serine/threonine-protein kinase n=1 Tax=Amycolatopsis magusensis TaxID=882444 RepID=A0ABS4PUM3_9PSEU|nr:zinc ribbon domain-containing protein [Amycolatopsis magusensis]MBP2183126.1 serine/threonine-protein kinase [Amycolatopsis magusensis]
MEDQRGQPPQWRYPPPYEAGWTAGMKSLTAVAITLVVGLLVTLTVVLVRQGQPDVVTAEPEQWYPAYVPPAATAPRYAPPTTTTTTPRATTTQPTRDSALSLLTAQVEEDRAQASGLVGYWLPQLSSKRPGLVVRGVTQDHDSIWADHQANKRRYPSALLLWSGDFDSFKYPDFWITVVPESFATGVAANEWCGTQGIGKDDCYAKRLAHSGGYEGNTLNRK